MEFLPDFRLGWLNGWLLLALLVLTDGVLFLAFRKNTVTRLFDRSGWTRMQIVITVIGKLLALVTVLMIVFTPLKLGSYVFIIGTIFVGLGLIGLVKALLDFNNSPSDQPVKSEICCKNSDMSQAAFRSSRSETGDGSNPRSLRS